MVSLKEYDVYELVPINQVSKGQKIIGSRFVFKQKADGRLKARLVVRVYSQEAGVDHGKTFAPVCRIGSQQIVLAIACEHDWHVCKLDVQVAFLQSPMEGEVYVKMASGQEETEPATGVPMVMKLKHSLHGLDQSPAV